MRQLVSKIQYRNFEQGEFVDERKRTLEEILQLIQDLPWAEQREGIEIKLTVPSVTIENEKGQFLKFAPYFNGKFVLYFLDGSNRLYKRSYVRVEHHFPLIADFFSEEGLNVSDLKQESTWSQHPEKDFIGQNFCYRVTGPSLRKFIISSSLINIVFGIVFLTMILYDWRIMPSAFGVGMLLMIFFIGGGANLVLVLHYYLYAQKRVLIMSQGNDEFYFGSLNSPKRYDKGDIELVITRKQTSGRSPLKFFAVCDIHFKNGDLIKIPNLMVDDHALCRKLYKCKQEVRQGFAWI